MIAGYAATMRSRWQPASRSELGKGRAERNVGKRDGYVVVRVQPDDAGVVVDGAAPEGDG